MPELTESDAIKMAQDYLSRRLSQSYAEYLVSVMGKADLAGLMRYAFDQGAAAQKAEK